MDHSLGGKGLPAAEFVLFDEYGLATGGEERCKEPEAMALPRPERINAAADNGNLCGVMSGHIE